MATRRDFLKVTSVVVGAGVLGAFGFWHFLRPEDYLFFSETEKDTPKEKALAYIREQNINTVALANVPSGRVTPSRLEELSRAYTSHQKAVTGFTDALSRQFSFASVSHDLKLLNAAGFLEPTTKKEVEGGIIGSVMSAMNSYAFSHPEFVVSHQYRYCSPLRHLHVYGVEDPLLHQQVNQDIHGQKHVVDFYETVQRLEQWVIPLETRAVGENRRAVQRIAHQFALYKTIVTDMLGEAGVLRPVSYDASLRKRLDQEWRTKGITQRSETWLNYITGVARESPFPLLLIHGKSHTSALESGATQRKMHYRVITDKDVP